jgi:hypothetical protein
VFYRYIDEEDLLRFMKKEEVDNLLPLIEGAAGTRKIKRKFLKNWLVSFLTNCFSYQINGHLLISVLPKSFAQVRMSPELLSSNHEFFLKYLLMTICSPIIFQSDVNN